MKKIIFSAAALLVLAGCSDTPEIDKVNTGANGGAIAFSAAAPGGGEQTRAEITDGISGLSFEWIKDTDQIGLFASDAGQSLAKNAAYAATADGASSGFAAVEQSGVIYWGAGAHNFYAYHPYNAAAGVDPTAIPVSVPAAQTQTADPLAHLESLVVTRAAIEGATEGAGTVSFQFQHLFAVVNVQLTSPDETLTVKAIKLNCTDNDETVAYDKATVDITTGAITVAPDAVKSNEVILTFDPAVTVAAETVNAYMVISAGHAGKTFDVIAVLGDDTERNITSKTVPSEGIPAGVKAIASAQAVRLQNGSEQYPYILSTAADLLNMKTFFNASDETTYFELGADIDMASIGRWEQFDTNSKGGIHFDGKGHVIKNLYVDGTINYSGFFGIMVGDVINTGFVDVFINAPNRTCGAIAGYIGTSGDTAGGRIENCYVTGKIIGDRPGGFAGVVGKTSASGSCHIKNCYSTAEISALGGSYVAGGIAALVMAGSVIENCYSTGAVAAVGGTNGAAGIAFEVQTGANITNSVAWNHSVASSVGGTPGRIAGKWAGTGNGENCWAYDGMKVCKGVTELTTTDSSAPASPYHGTAKSAGDIRTWITANWSSDVWNTTGEYPILKWQYERGDYATLSGHSDPHPELGITGDGTSGSPYILKSAYDLLFMRQLFVASTVVYFELAADLDMKELGFGDYPYDWVPLNYGNNYVNWVHFDGKGHSIKNLYATTSSISAVDYIGFFGVLIGDCINLGLEDVDIVGTGKSCGAFGGYLGLRAGGTQGGRIENCYSTGRITTNNMAGGLIARVGGPDSYIKNSYSTVNITASGTEAAGGLVAWVYRGGSVENCYAAGNITASASNRIGGFAYSTEAENTTITSGGNITKSIAWNSSVRATGITPGRFTGAWAGNGTGADCFAYSGMALYDGETPVTGIEDSSTPATPYHGVAKTNAELKAWIATNWDTSIWDTSGVYPKLKVLQ